MKGRIQTSAETIFFPAPKQNKNDKRIDKIEIHITRSAFSMHLYEPAT